MEKARESVLTASGMRHALRGAYRGAETVVRDALGFDYHLNRGMLIEAARIALEDPTLGTIGKQERVIAKALDNHLTKPFAYGYTRLPGNGSRSYLTDGEVRNFASEVAFWKVATQTGSPDVVKFAVQSAIERKDYAMLAEADFDLSADWSVHTDREALLLRGAVREAFAKFEDNELLGLMATPRYWAFDWLGSSCSPATKGRMMNLLTGRSDWDRIAYMKAEDWPGKKDWALFVDRAYKEVTANDFERYLARRAGYRRNKTLASFVKYANNEVAQRAKRQAGCKSE